MVQFQGTQLLQFLHQTCITQLGWKVYHGQAVNPDEPRDGVVGFVSIGGEIAIFGEFVG